MKTIIKIIIIFSFLFPNENKDFDYSENSFSMMKSMILPGWGEFDEYKKHKKDHDSCCSLGSELTVSYV